MDNLIDLIPFGVIVGAALMAATAAGFIVGKFHERGLWNALIEEGLVPKPATWWQP